MEWGTFDSIFLINLPDREDRKRELERELRRVGLKADNPKLVWVRAVRPLDAGEFPSIGARGCFMSHLACLRSARDSGHSRILILEDDACFPGSRVDGLKVALATLEDRHWDIWYGGGIVYDDLISRIDGIEMIPLDHRLGVQTSHCIALQGDAIDSVRTFFELILTRAGGHPEAGPMHVDGAYSTWRALNPTAVTLIAAPPVCVQRLSRSDVATTHWYDRSPILRRSVGAIRRLRTYLRHHI